MTCGACNTSNRQIGDVVFAKKIGGNPPKQQKPPLNQTTYTVHAPSSIERLRRSSYRHSLEQASVESNRIILFRHMSYAFQDQIACPSQALNLKLMVALVMVSIRSEFGFAELAS